MPAEFNTLPHVRGAVSAARAGDPNSANSQFFIVFSPRLTLDGKYSVFGRVVSGMQYVDAIERGEPPSDPSRVLRASVGTDNVAPPTPQEVAAMMQRQPAPVAAPVGIAQTGTAPTQQ
jgi:peptidylprolyl isomerase